MTTLPLVLLFATAAFGYTNVVGFKPLGTITKSDLENRVSNEGSEYYKSSYSGNEGQSGYIGNEDTTVADILPASDSEIIAKSEAHIATGCFGNPESVPEPTINTDANEIIFPDNTAPSMIGAYPPRPLIDPVPQFADRIPNSGMPPFHQIPHHPFMHHRYNQFMTHRRPFMSLPPSPMFQRFAMQDQFYSRPPPIVIVKLLQPIILPVVKAEPEKTTPVPDFEEFGSSERLNNGRQLHNGRRFEGRRIFNRAMPLEDASIKSNSDDTMHISVRVF